MKKRWYIVILIAVLLGIRVALPYIIKDYLNRTLNSLEGYTGEVQDVDLNLYRGAYKIHEIRILKTKGEVPVPFVKVKKMDLSIHWRAIFNGALVGEIVLFNPIINFAVAQEGEIKQDGAQTNWTKPLTELMPLHINRFEVKDGRIAYHNFTTSPEVNVFVDSLQLLATNLSNVKNTKKALPSNLKVIGTSVGNGKLNIEADMDILQEIPQLDLTFKFENAELFDFNDFIKAHTYADIEEGLLSVYAEIIIKNKQITGYIKPIIENLDILNWDEEEGDFLHKSWEAIAAGLGEIFENQAKEQNATEIPIKGKIKHADVDVWKTVWNVFKNAFVEAFSKQVDGKIEYHNNSG